MSYQRLHVDDEREDVLEDIYPGLNSQPEQISTERRYFNSPNALHTAISIAAGTVMTLFGYEVRDSGSRRVAITDVEYSW